jgi:hypothetical protein
MRTRFGITPLIARRARAQRLARMPSEAPEGWSIHPNDPAGVVQAFPPLRVRDGFRLIAYQYREGGDGNAVVYAVPSEAAVVPPDDCPRDEARWLAPPTPPGALDDLRVALDGDGSPAAFLAASLAYRELLEFGAAWHGQSWSTHELIGADPRHHPASRKRLTKALLHSAPADLHWVPPEVDEWAPHVDIDDTQVVVRFISASAVGHECIVQHEDAYVPGQLRFESTERVLAQGGMGYRF